MIHEDDTQNWIDCWNASILRSDLITDEKQAERWSRKAGSFATDIDPERQKKKTSLLFQLLQEAGFSPEGAKILDIGCGPGSLSIPLAQAGSEVTALDISSGMLERLRETAEQEGLRIRTIESSWWTADIDAMGLRNGFDLVIASMTPGIRDVETLERMIACSRKYCYYSNFIRADPEKIPSDIYVRILGKTPKNNPFSSGFIYPFIYLYTLGFRPILKINRKSVKRELDWNEAAEKALDYIELTQELTDENRTMIRDYYRSISDHGMYKGDYEMFTGMMVWSV
jgi:SAM-dependent methyltransferase